MKPLEYFLLGITTFLVVAIVGETVVTMLSDVELTKSAGLTDLLSVQKNCCLTLIGWAVGAHNKAPAATMLGPGTQAGKGGSEPPAAPKG